MTWQPNIGKQDTGRSKRITKSPEGGIPARTTVGDYERCGVETVFRYDVKESGDIIQGEEKFLVFNMFSEPVEGDVWIMVCNIAGKWFVDAEDCV